MRKQLPTPDIFSFYNAMLENHLWKRKYLQVGQGEWLWCLSAWYFVVFFWSLLKLCFMSSKSLVSPCIGMTQCHWQGVECISVDQWISSVMQFGASQWPDHAMSYCQLCNLHTSKQLHIVNATTHLVHFYTFFALVTLLYLLRVFWDCYILVQYVILCHAHDISWKGRARINVGVFWCLV